MTGMSFVPFFSAQACVGCMYRVPPVVLDVNFNVFEFISEIVFGAHEVSDFGGWRADSFFSLEYCVNKWDSYLNSRIAFLSLLLVDLPYLPLRSAYFSNVFGSLLVDMSLVLVPPGESVATSRFAYLSHAFHYLAPP